MTYETGPIPAVDGECPDRYVTSADVHIDAGTDLATTFSAEIEGETSSTGDFDVQVPLANVDGTRRPTSFSPDDFASTWLAVTAVRANGAWSAELGWYASNGTGDTGVDPQVGEVAGEVDPSR